MKDTTNTKRCAIYTRKSCEDGLELEYNLLDAQYDAAASYVRGQIANGWEIIPKRYDDGGFSGGNMERPALKELIADIESNKIDIVVVYKIDRLSRSLCDFTDLSKLFEDHDVSFVSVTQQIDTSNAAGRMMLNILMSFAQFEREQSADRVRDKVYATKKKGMWTGGKRPYGYKIVNKELKIDPNEAPAVRLIFERYAATGSSFQVARELNASSYKRPDGIIWISRHVMKIIKNRMYAGEVLYRKTGEIFKAAHDPLVEKELFDRVNAMIGNKGGRGHYGRDAMLSPLTDLIRCGHCGCSMTPTTSRCKPGTLKRYFYYRCSHKTKGYQGDCDTPIIPADVIEKLVRDQLNPILLIEPVVNAVAGALPEARAEFAAMVADMPGFWDAMEPAERIRLFKLLVKEVRVYADHAEIAFTFENAVRSLPLIVKRNYGRLCLHVEGDGSTQDLSVDRTLRQGQSWVDSLLKMHRRAKLGGNPRRSRARRGRKAVRVYRSKKELSRAANIHSSIISRLTRLCFLSPTIIEKIAAGELRDISVNRMIPVTTPFWAEQERALGVE